MIEAPPELAQRPQWVAWRYVQRPGEPKPTKVPYNARTGRAASTTDPQTWSSYLEACSYAEGHADGIGYVLSEDDPYVGVDLDHCRDPESGSIEMWAKVIVRRLASYTEISPSQTGLRIFVKGELPPYGRHKGQIEVYSKARFMTVTGMRYLATSSTINQRQDELATWHREVFGEKPVLTVVNGHARAPTELADTELLTVAQRANNGGRFLALWNGDYSGYGSQSEADLALVNLLAFYCGPDQARIERLFELSGLMREKWERADYRTWTISKALEGRTEYYDPHYRSQPESRVQFGVGTNGTAAPPPAAEPAVKDYRLVQVASVMTDVDQIEQLVEGLKWRKRVHWTFAGPGTGKTFWEIAVGLHIAAGKPFLGREVIQGPVALIEEDSPVDSAVGYVETLCEIYGFDQEALPFYINELQGLRLKDDAGIATARAAIDEWKPIAVILDAAERLVPSKEFSSSELDSFDRFLKGLINDNIVPTVIDHINRRGRQEPGGKKKSMPGAPVAKVPPLDLLYGGQSKHAMSDVMLFLEGRFRDGPVQVSWEKFRVSGAQPPNFSLRFDDDHGFAMTEHRKEPSTDLQRQFCRYLEEHPEWHNFADLQSLFTMNDKRLRRTLYALVAERWVETAGTTTDRRWRYRQDVPVSLG